MTTTTTGAAAPPPSPFVILFVYALLGTVLSFAFGRQPGTMPHDWARELAPVCIVICCFLVTYSLWDVMTVGITKFKYNRHVDSKPYNPKDNAVVPEPVYLAQRVQTNQVEQMPVFLVASITCAIFVNGTLAAFLALVWSILRRLYAAKYRASVGVALQDKGLATFTVPAYFIVNGMLISVVVQSIRCLVQTQQG